MKVRASQIGLIIVLSLLHVCAQAADQNDAGEKADSRGPKLLYFPVQGAVDRADVCIVLLNEGVANCLFYEATTLTDFKFEATLGGEVVGETRYWANYLKSTKIGGSSAEVTVKPSEHRAWTLTLSRLFDTSVDGIYHFKISRTIKDGLGKDTTLACNFTVSIKNTDGYGRDMTEKEQELLHTRLEAWLKERQSRREEKQPSAEKK